MSKNPINFSKDFAELEAIVEWFESGDVDLDKGLTKFERGMELATGLKNYLESVENKVEVIKKKFNAPSKSDASAEPPEEETEVAEGDENAETKDDTEDSDSESANSDELDDISQTLFKNL